MKPQSIDQNIIRRYLLGELSEQERAEIQDMCFADDVFFEGLLIAEEELIDDYARGDLSRKERERFEQRFMSSPDGRERVEFAKTMIDSARSVAEPVSWWKSLKGLLYGAGGPGLATQYAFAAMLIVMFLGSAWLVVQNVRLKNRLESVEVALKGENEQLRGQVAEQKQSNEQLGEKVKELDRQLGQMQELDQTVAALPPAPQFETIQEVLDPRTAGQASGSEGGEPQPKRVNVPAGTGIVILKLRFEDGEYKSYRAVVKTAGGEEVWNQSSLRAKEAGSGSQVQLRLPAGRLSEGKHIITLSGLDAEKEYKTVSRYSFEVVKGKYQGARARQ